MTRFVLSLTLLLAGLVGPAVAPAATVLVPAAGEVRTIAFAGDGIVVARQPPSGGIVVEHMAPGVPLRTLLSTTLAGRDDQVSLAASTAAVAVGLLPNGGESFGAGRVLAGPLGGPLREVARCQAGLVVAPVAVSGERIAWREGGCGEPAATPRDVGPSAVVTAGADPSAPVTRAATEPGSLPVALVMAGEDGLVGLLRPSFFTVDSEVRRFGPAGLGVAVAGEDGRVVSPVGLLDDGTSVFSFSALDQQSGPAGCVTSVFVIAPDSADRRGINLGGCLLEEDYPSVPRVRAAGDRIHALVDISGPVRPGVDRPPTIALVSIRADGTDRRVLTRGTYRAPLGIAAAAGRVAWWQPSCAGGNEILLQAAAGTPATAAVNASCRVEVLTRRARVRDGSITLRLRCPTGCAAVALDETGDVARPLREFVLQPGTHTMRLRIAQATRRRGRLRLALVVASGPSRVTVIRLLR